MTAAAALIDETERRPVDRDILIYPILFSYRHGLEVAMKWTIEQYGSLAIVSLDPDHRNHDLWALWKLCKEISAAATEGEEGEVVQAVEHVVKDFQQIDKSGIAFRYSKNKVDVIITLPADRIDLGNVQRVMEAVDNFFRAATAGSIISLLRNTTTTEPTEPAFADSRWRRFSRCVWVIFYDASKPLKLRASAF